MNESFIKASQQKLRFNTGKGMATVEDLWDLPLERLDTIARDLRKELNDVAEGSFIKPVNTKATAKLRLSFDIAVHVINIRMAEAAKREQAAAIASQNRLIDEIIAQKQYEELKGNKTIDELLAMKKSV